MCKLRCARDVSALAFEADLVKRGKKGSPARGNRGIGSDPLSGCLSSFGHWICRSGELATVDQDHGDTPPRNVPLAPSWWPGQVLQHRRGAAQGTFSSLGLDGGVVNQIANQCVQPGSILDRVAGLRLGNLA